ncbi:MAG: chloride channel protein [Deltaproteobacteria bacterium]|nr:MAG: chloride channel protein [Deltaproteobacteria bacterium]TMQ18861.1 MAG: chloride channel protein [Deltaproteobacteria bacterium]
MTTAPSHWWRRWVAVIAVALVAAGFAIAFRISLAAVDGALGGDSVVAMITAAPIWERIALPAAGGLLVGLVLLVAARVREGAGVGFVIEAIVLGRVRVPLTRSVLQALASWLAIASGNSLGREGPLIQFGAAAGEGARRVLALDNITARIVLATGVAAGFASAYNAPVAAVLFVVEIVTGVVVLEAIVPMLVAVVIATIATRYAVGGAPLYGLRAFALESPAELVAFAGLGLCAAPVGVGFLRLLGLVGRLWRKLPVPWRPAAGGLLCGAILAALPLVAGNGFEPLDALLDGKLAVATVIWLVVAKPIATALAVGSGNPGGVFTPTLLLGGCTGTLYAIVLHAVLGDAIGSPSSYALVGLAAALSATTHAPLTSAVLACELSGDYALLLPLLVATALAAAWARRLYVDSVYTAELSRRGLRWRLTLDGRRVIESQQDTVDVV